MDKVPTASEPASLAVGLQPQQPFRRQDTGAAAPANLSSTAFAELPKDYVMEKVLTGLGLASIAMRLPPQQPFCKHVAGTAVTAVLASTGFTELPSQPDVGAAASAEFSSAASARLPDDYVMEKVQTASVPARIAARLQP